MTEGVAGMTEGVVGMTEGVSGNDNEIHSTNTAAPQTTEVSMV